MQNIPLARSQQVRTIRCVQGGQQPRSIRAECVLLRECAQEWPEWRTCIDEHTHIAVWFRQCERALDLPLGLDGVACLRQRSRQYARNSQDTRGAAHLLRTRERTEQRG